MTPPLRHFPGSFVHIKPIVRLDPRSGENWNSLIRFIKTSGEFISVGKREASVCLWLQRSRHWFTDYVQFENAAFGEVVQLSAVYEWSRGRHWQLDWYSIHSETLMMKRGNSFLRRNLSIYWSVYVLTLSWSHELVSRDDENVIVDTSGCNTSKIPLQDDWHDINADVW